MIFKNWRKKEVITLFLRSQTISVLVYITKEWLEDFVLLTKQNQIHFGLVRYYSIELVIDHQPVYAYQSTSVIWLLSTKCDPTCNNGHCSVVCINSSLQCFSGFITEKNDMRITNQITLSSMLFSYLYDYLIYES